MKKLAIISTYNENCGNASYTHVLRNAFAEHVEVEIISLDLFLLQKKGKFYTNHGDRHIDEIAKKLKNFDYVNIQFEAGLYGSSNGMVYRRIVKLIKASKNLVLTMHRVDPPEMNAAELVNQVVRLRMPGLTALKTRRRGQYAELYKSIVDACAARVKASQNVWIAVHTRREYRIVKDLYGFKNVFSFPITFLQPEERKAVQNQSDPSAFRKKHHIPEGVQVIGAFGFISKYKGYETLIKALTILPDNYHLYIFGSQHPQSLIPNKPLDPYLKELFDLINKLDPFLKEPFDIVGQKKKTWTERKLPHLRHLLSDSSIVPLNKSFYDRIHFMGGISDPDFIEALRFSDYTVLPYLEVGQSMSGVISLAIEAGANLFCTTNHSFNEARKIWGDVYHTFDIGNHFELAQKLQFADKDFSEQRDKSYLQYNINENVRKHLEVLGYNFTE